MLFDGALKFTKLARQTLDPEANGGELDFEKLYENTSRAQKIVLELSTGMKTEAAPEIVEKLAALYNYVYRLLIDVNMDRDLGKLDEAIKLLEYERQTWAMVMEKGAAERGTTSGHAPTTTQQTALGAYGKSA